MTVPGNRTLLDSLRETASRCPEATAIRQIVINGEKEESFCLTYLDLVKRIDELSWWLNEKVVKGKDGKTPPTIAYLAPNDLRTLLLPLAAAECDLVVLLLSPRNSFEAQAHLIATTQCSALIVDKVFDHVASQINTVQHIEAPDLWQILTKREINVTRHSTLTTWKNSRNKGVVKLHTSGSTGLPKPVQVTHGTLSTVDIQRHVTDSQDRPCQLAIFAQAKSPYTAFPFFHVAGFELACFMLFSGSEMVLGPPHQPTSLEIVRTVLRIAKPDALLLPPSILDDIVLDTTLLSQACRAKLIVYGGGQVSDNTGDVLSKRTHLFQGIGSTEAGSICMMPLAPQHWKYFHFATENGITWEPVGTASEEYELVITKSAKNLPYQAVFHSFPELSEWRTKDIFAKHPTVEGLWNYRGRLDDLIVLSTGEKLTPSVIEAVILSNCSHVKSALVIGGKRPRPALLVELIDTSEGTYVDQDKLKNEIAQSLASDRSQEVSRDGQIAPEDIIICSTEKPFIRTAKGTINRRSTQDIYASEIEAVYSASASKGGRGGEWILDCSSVNALQSSLLKQFQGLLRAPTLEANNNLFYFGLDSRQAQLAALSIRKALAPWLSDDNRSSDFKAESIYTHPTVSSLSDTILARGPSKRKRSEDQGTHYERLLNATLAQYLNTLKPIGPGSRKLKTNGIKSGHHVLLTGSTGFVGTYILQALSARSEINKITCLDRANPARASHLTSQQPTFNDDKGPSIKKYAASLDAQNLGISSEDYQELLASVSCVVHCQWPVDFNQALSHFEPNIKGAVNLVQFCQESLQDCPLIFLSSIATVQRCPMQPIPELHLSVPEYCQTGYGESKLLASEFLNHAADHGNLNTVICRLGQVCGPLDSNKQDNLPSWPSRDWFPTLLRCSKFIGYLPKTLGKASRIDWIPVDVLSEALADEIVSQSKGVTSVPENGIGKRNGAIYRQLVNPMASNYQELLPQLQKRFMRDDHSICKVVSLQQWTKELEDRCLQVVASQSGQDPPGTELLQFFQELSKTSEHNSTVMETKNTVAALPRLKNLSAVDGASLEKWLDAWGI